MTVPGLLLLLHVTACGDSPPVEPEADGGTPPERDAGPGGMVGMDAGPGTPACDCADDEVCVEGECQALPARCPCPMESYCDVARDSCVPGCLDDGFCSSGRICDAEARRCREGCRSDATCGTGRICEGLLCREGCRDDAACGGGRICDALVCRAGCRGDGDCAGGEVCEATVCSRGCTGDSGCGAGSICESLRCRPGCRDDRGCGGGEICDGSSCRGGCRTDTDCGAGATCRATPLTCTTCPADPDEATDTSFSTTGRSVSERRTRVLCGPMDMDRVTWNEGPPNPGYYSESIWVTVSGADDAAVTTVTLDGEDHSVGNGTTTLRRDSFDYYCFMGMCASDRYVLTARTTSEAPVTIEFGFSVSPTR